MFRVEEYAKQHLLAACFSLSLPFDPEHVGGAFLQNISTLLGGFTSQNIVASRPVAK
jgi:hypothetical protein